MRGSRSLRQRTRDRRLLHSQYTACDLACSAGSNCVFERNARIRQLLEVGSSARGNDFSRCHLILGAVDAVDRNELAVTQIAGAEAAGGRAAAGYNGVVTLAYPHDDHLQIVLIGPEPRHLVMDGGVAEKIQCRCRRLFERIIDRLQSQSTVVVEVRMVSAVSCGKDMWVRRATVRIHGDPIRALDTGGDRQLVRRQHTYTDDDDIRRMLRAILGENGTHSARLWVPGERLHLCIADDSDAMPRVLL